MIRCPKCDGSRVREALPTPTKAPVEAKPAPVDTAPVFGMDVSKDGITTVEGYHDRKTGITHITKETHQPPADTLDQEAGKP